MDEAANQALMGIRKSIDVMREDHKSDMHDIKDSLGKINGRVRWTEQKLYYFIGIMAVITLVGGWKLFLD